MPEPNGTDAALPGDGSGRVRLPAIVACLLIFTLLAWLAGRELMADITLSIAYQEAASGDRRSPAEKWSQAGQYFTTSLRFSPRNPYTLEAFGAHEITGMRSGHDVSRSPNDILKSAIDRLHAALRERPTSPNAWANLALAKLFLAEFDEELFRAIRHADELAPWEFEIQRAVLIASLGAWMKLDASQQAATSQTVARAAQRDLPALGRLLRTFQRLDLLCDNPEAPPKAQDYCRSLPQPAAPIPVPPREAHPNRAGRR